MKYRCPNEECTHSKDLANDFFIKKGYFKTKHNHQPVPRYQCKGCGRKFSSHTFRDTFRQHKPALNAQIFKLYCAGTTQRRLAIILGCHRKTIIKKFLFLAAKARRIHNEKIEAGGIKTSYVQFDEMETSEHTKMKPLSIAIAVRAKTGEIIDLQVATMKCKGHLARYADVRYDNQNRVDTRLDACKRLLETVLKCSKPSITVASDAKRVYPSLVKETIPHAEVVQYTAGRASTEKPLFMLNHVCSLLRHDLSRLARKTWVTTKNAERLQAHLDLYIAWQNGYNLC